MPLYSTETGNLQQLTEIKNTIGLAIETPAPYTLQDRVQSLIDAFEFENQDDSLQAQIEAIREILEPTQTPVPNNLFAQLQKISTVLGQPNDLYAGSANDSGTLMEFIKLLVIQLSSLNTYSENNDHNTASSRAFDDSDDKTVVVGPTEPTVLLTDVEPRKIWTLYHNGTDSILIRMKGIVSSTKFNFPLPAGYLYRDNFRGQVSAISTTGNQPIIVTVRDLL